MSMIQGGQLQLPSRIRTVSSSGRANSTQPPLPYLGAVGTIPLSVPAGAIRHHPSAGQVRAGSASGDH
ncbi:MAG TPA: hypothetical protein VFW71_02910 [Actinomycetota bacterium]|nr:hypothetical protein [Actinomycetota bacterium]